MQFFHLPTLSFRLSFFVVFSVILRESCGSSPKKLEIREIPLETTTKMTKKRQKNDKKTTTNMTKRRQKNDKKTTNKMTTKIQTTKK